MGLLRGIERAMRGAREQPLVQLIAIGTVAVCLVLVGVVELCAENLGGLADSWGKSAQMIVYLEDGIAPARIAQLSSALAKFPGVDAVKTIDSQSAYERMRKSLGPRADLLDGVEPGFLPASIELTLKPGLAEMIRVHPSFERLRHMQGVEEVELGGGWARRLEAIESVVHKAGLLVGLLVLGACLYVIASTIRLGLHARRDELEILRLVGATERFVKMPFLIEGALQGLGGAGLACLFLYGIYAISHARLEALLGDLVAAAPIAFFGTAELGLVLGAGLLMGLIGSSVALSRMVRT